MGKVEVRLAEYAGACYGVQRALDMTYQVSSEGGRVWTLGPLIHNPRVVNELEEEGIVAASSVDDITEGSVVIRSHGVVPETIEELKRREFRVVDATCPHVLRAQRAAEKLARDGFYVLVIGEAGHPEVEGISAHARAAGGKCSIVAEPADIPEALPAQVGVVVQTTQSRKVLNAVVDALCQKGIQPLVKDTICFATTQRQEAAVQLAQDAQVMIVIGGRNSSNTTRLFELCQQYCDHAYHIETVDEIDPAWFEEGMIVGVSAGASTPENQIDAVVSFLESL